MFAFLHDENGQFELNCVPTFTKCLPLRIGEELTKYGSY